MVSVEWYWIALGGWTALAVGFFLGLVWGGMKS